MYALTGEAGLVHRLRACGFQARQALEDALDALGHTVAEVSNT